MIEWSVPKSDLKEMRILPSQSPPQTAAILNSTFPLIITRLWGPANSCARTVRDPVFYGGHSRYQKEHLASWAACWWFAEWLQLFGTMLVIVWSHSQGKPGSLGTRSTPGAHVGSRRHLTEWPGALNSEAGEPWAVGADGCKGLVSFQTLLTRETKDQESL